MIDPDRPRWKAPELRQAARITQPTYAMRRRQLGLYPGHIVKSGARRFTLTDIACAVALETLVILGLSLEVANGFAEAWRRNLSNTLRARMNYGVWSRVTVLMEGNLKVQPAQVSLDAICEQTIKGLGLPLPVLAKMPAPKVAAIIVNMVANYLQSPDWQWRVDQFRAEVIARKRPTNWEEVSVTLAVPLWIIREGTRSIRVDAAAAAAAVKRGDEETTPISVAHLLHERLGGHIVGAAS